MNRLTTIGYEGYAKSVALETLQPVHARASAPLIAPCGRAFELVYNISTKPLDPTSLFSCLYHNKIKNSPGNAADSNVGARSACAIDGMGTGGHPSPLGSYLVACVLYGAIFHQCTY
jgi:hypothetical protein